jgi:rhamnulokinase
VPALRSFIDPDDSRFLNPPDMPAAIQSYCRQTNQPVPDTEGSLVRCALESLALKYQAVLSSLEEVLGNRIDVVHVVGGGSRNDLLNQFTASACVRPIVAGPVEATILGNLLVQTRASGESVALADLRAIVLDSAELREFEPDSAEASAWEDARTRFEQIIKDAPINGKR